MLLRNKKALVTGGSRGIGKAIVTRFLEEGAEVFIISKHKSPFHKEIVDTALAHETRFHWFPGDVSIESGITETVEAILRQAKGMDILVNNAGITRDGLSFTMSSKDWEQVIRTNLFSAFYISRPITLKMIRQKGGSIINISSVSGILGNIGQVNYSSSKGGMIGFTKSLARETASRGIRVNAIAPGYIETEMTRQIKKRSRDRFRSMIPMGRAGSPNDVANSAVFLASDLSSYITGHVLGVDGGVCA